MHLLNVASASWGLTQNRPVPCVPVDCDAYATSAADQSLYLQTRLQRPCYPMRITTLSAYPPLWRMQVLAPREEGFYDKGGRREVKVQLAHPSINDSVTRSPSAMLDG